MNIFFYLSCDISKKKIWFLLIWSSLSSKKTISVVIKICRLNIYSVVSFTVHVCKVSWIFRILLRRRRIVRNSIMESLWHGITFLAPYVRSGNNRFLTTHKKRIECATVHLFPFWNYSIICLIKTRQIKKKKSPNVITIPTYNT